VVVVGATSVSGNLYEEGQGRRLGLTKASCIARSSWGYVRSMWVSRCIALRSLNHSRGQAEEDQTNTYNSLQPFLAAAYHCMVAAYRCMGAGYHSMPDI
jgi:hypothetical protein